MSKWICIASMLMGQLLLAQGPEKSSSDSLVSFSYSQLLNAYKKERDSSNRTRYLNAYLQKAKYHKHFEKIVAGYKNLLHNSPEHKRLSYADSMVLTAEKSKDSLLLAKSYLTKGVVFYRRTMYSLALDNYLKANALVSNAKESRYLRYKIKYNIAHIKQYLGDYQEALVLFNDCLEFYVNSYPRPYLNTLHSVALCHSNLGNYSLSNDFCSLGLETGMEIGNQSMDPYFLLLQGVNAYHLKSYHQAIKILCDVLPEMERKRDFANETSTRVHIGLSLWEMGRFDAAISYFQDMDSTFSLKNYINPQFIQAYKHLIDYYAKENNQERQSFYSQRLIAADSVIHNKYKELSSTVYKEYNLAKLEVEKNKLYEKSTRLKQYGFLLTLLVTLLLGYILWRWKQSKFSQKQYHLSEEIQLQEDSDSDQNVPPDTREAILHNLKKFEQQKDYLDDVNLGALAIKFNTNSKYLSMIIKDAYNKTFTSYINDLKVDELTRLLSDKKQIRHYNYSNLTELLNFGSISRFTRAFKSRTGMTVQGYIQQLEKSERHQKTSKSSGYKKTLR